MGTKWLSRLVITAAVGLSSLLMLPMPVAAGWAWCEVDPLIVIDGHQVTLEGLVGGEEAAVAQAIKGNTWFKVYVPRGVDTEIISTETKVKVQIFEDKNLEISDGVVPFIVVLSINTPRADYPMIMIMKVTVENSTTFEVESATAVEGNTANALKAQFTLP